MICHEPNAPPAQPQQQQQAAPKPEPAEIGSKGDYQLNQALNLLKGLQIISRK